MQVKLTDSGEVQFLDGDHINRNSLNRKVLVVTPETALATRESLWVQFGDSQNFEDVNANILEPIRLTEEADGYKTIFPDEVVKKAGVWYMTLAVRMYSTDGTTFSEQLTSDKVSFTVNDSYPMGDNGYISNGTLENAWQQIEAAVQDAAGSADEAEQSAMNAEAAQDAAGNDIAATYAKQTGTYPNMSVGTASEAAYADAAASADTAGYATTAKGDASGNDIEATYAKQTGTYAGMTVGNATQAGSANDPNAVHFTAQTLTDEQKAQARTNIGAADAGTVATNTSDIADLESDVQKIIDGTTSVAEAAHADTADSATKAAQDAAGNVIADTYAKQQGSYPQMSVGNASNATLASNSNMLGGVAAASYALKQNSSGGFAGGNGASTLAGAAVGNGATAAAGFAGGDHASTTGAGGAAGSSAMTTNGGAVGNGTSSTTGFAGGQNSNTTTGAAIGTSAVASGAGAVQLGTGNNTAANTLQFRSFLLADSGGNIPYDRLKSVLTSGSLIAAVTLTGRPGTFSPSYRGKTFIMSYSANATKFVEVTLWMAISGNIVTISYGGLFKELPSNGYYPLLSGVPHPIQDVRGAFNCNIQDATAKGSTYVGSDKNFGIQVLTDKIPSGYFFGGATYITDEFD